MSRNKLVAAVLRNACCCSLALSCVVGTAWAADLYKWVDDKGVVHYTDTPPPSNAKKPERVRADTGSTSTLDAPVVAGADPAKDKVPPKADPPPPPPPVQDTAENRARLCDQSTATVELLQSKFAVADASGKQLDDKARADRLASERETAAKYCSPTP